MQRVIVIIQCVFMSACMSALYVLCICVCYHLISENKIFCYPDELSAFKKTYLFLYIGICYNTPARDI